MAFILRDRFINVISGSSINESTGSSPPSDPPTFDIDLSVPPEQRYVEVSAAFRPGLENLRLLLDDLGAQILSPIPASWLHKACWLFLRHVYDKEQTRELQGISTAAGVSMYLLVLFNNILDVLMGCSSGGACISDDHAPGRTKMVHFRTLDWEMPILRQLVVQLRFRETRDGPIIASCLTYAGYVGVLTGVRQGFSESLNFRSSRNDSGHIGADIAYFWHAAMVLLGQRPSIASIMRGFLLPKKDARGRSCPPPSYKDVVRRMPSMKTPTCYLCFSNGQETTVFEKDHISAEAYRSTEFIAVTNNDAVSQPSAFPPPLKKGVAEAIPGVEELLQDSIERRHCVQENWRKLCAVKSQTHEAASTGKVIPSDIHISDIVELIQKYPTTNKKTHFACVMDPEEGVIHWCRRWERSIAEEWIREHR